MAEPLKYAYSSAYVQTLAEQIFSVYSDFKKEDFIQSILDNEWEERALKDRMRHISVCMGKFLPSSFQDAVEVLNKIADRERPSSYQALADMCFPDFVEVHGLEEPEMAFSALEYLTQFSSSEFAIRPFIVKYPEMTMKQMKIWASSETHHTRRLASEGCRPRLPWGIALKAFKKDPVPILPILEMLKEDESDYVRRSVANNLNDIAKDHPDFVLEIGNKWIGNHPHTDWIVKHASRTLLKQGHPKALALFGFTENPKVEIKNFSISEEKINIGDTLNFNFELSVKSNQSAKLRIEYGIYYVKANGKTSRKVFHISEGIFEASSNKIFSQKQSFANMTTRKHYSGVHRLVLIINGNELEEKSFQVEGQ